ncbi:glycosyltransferase family 39 protein [Saccharopolyspora erythraea]|nr:glycosyltransferase family 39 protein [Saccharopolyspora erythraea]
MAGVVGVVLLATSAVGGYWFDELYFVAAGRHAAWGYADQPWLVPVLAAGLDALVPDSPVLLRLPATLTAALGVVVTAQIARELGGGRRAQVLAAGAYAVSPWLVSSAHWLATYTLDPFWWLVIGWLVIRWTRLREQGADDDRPLLWAGIVTALALQTKFLVPLLWIGLGVAVLACGPRDLLRRPLLWVGAGIAVLVTVPTLVWQALNGWPYLEFTQVVGAEANRLDLITAMPVHAGLVGSFFLGYALWRLSRSDTLRPYRFLAVAFAAVLVLCLVVDGRSYYTAGMFGPLFAVAAVELARRDLARWWRWVAWPCYALSAAATAGMLALIVASSGAVTTRPAVEPVAAAYHALPPQTRDRTAIVTEIYPTAATLDHYAEELGLPGSYSPHRGYWYFGAPPESAENVLYASAGDADRLRPYFARSRPVDPAVQLWLFEDRTQPWSVVWPQVRFGLSTN